MARSRHRACAVCEAEGHLLLVRLRDPKSKALHFYPPGGGIEPDESPAQTAEREALEETGVRVHVDPAVELVDQYPFHWNGIDYDCTTHYFAATLEGKFDPALAPVDDASFNEGAAWLPTAEGLEALAVHPRIATAVARVLGRARRLAWRRDPRLAGPAQMLLLIHDQFRLASERLRFVLAREPEVDLGWIARMFQPLAETLHHHHHAEEVMLFAAIREKTGTDPKRLTADHDELKTVIDAAFAALRPGGAAEEAAAVLAKFDDVLIDHLDREEALAMPLLLDGFEPQGV